MFRIQHLRCNELNFGEKRYFLLAEYHDRFHSDVSIYLEVAGEQVIVLRNGKILVGKLNKTTVLGFIEDTVTLNGFDVMESGFEEIADVAIKQIGKLPIVTIVKKMNHSKIRAAIAGIFRVSKSGLTLKELRDSFCEYEEEPEDSQECFDENDVMGFSCNIFPATSLSSKWTWEQWDDGSGHLRGPEGESLFSYDLAPYQAAGGIEYKDINGKWTVFDGSLSHYMRFAESQISDMFLLKV